MGRALKPTRRLRPAEVKPGDVILVKVRGHNLRWMIVDRVIHGASIAWAGRWAFGGQPMFHVEHREDAQVVAKDERDARDDARRLAGED